MHGPSLESGLIQIIHNGKSALNVLAKSQFIIYTNQVKNQFVCARQLGAYKKDFITVQKHRYTLISDFFPSFLKCHIINHKAD